MVNNQPSASLTLFTFWFTVFCSDNELFFFWITPCFFPGLTAHLLFFSPKQMGCTPSLWLLPWQNANGSACSQRWSSAQRTSWGVAWVLTVSPVCCSSIQSLWSHDPEGVHQEPQGASSHRISVWVTHTHTHTHTAPVQVAAAFVRWKNGSSLLCSHSSHISHIFESSWCHSCAKNTLDRIWGHVKKKFCTYVSQLLEEKSFLVYCSVVVINCLITYIMISRKPPESTTKCCVPSELL